MHGRVALPLVGLVLGLCCCPLGSASRPDDYVEDVTVRTQLGSVTGFVAQLTPDFAADIFLGIPFAQAPIDDLRFEKPQPVTPWKSPLSAQTFAPGCWPHALSGLSADLFSDDCLKLNIFRPNDQSTRPASGWPVLVWVHGGGFEVGAAFFYPYSNITINFASQGLIVAVIQYRLGFTGFASTGDAAMPGNLGYWDQAEAFKFLKHHVASFGGDPDKIVAFGLSAGGASTAALSLSPASRDFISSSIEMSGSVFANWAASDAVIEVTNQMARELGCPTTQASSEELKQCFKRKDPQEFLAAMERLGTARRDVNLLKFHPRIDGDFFPHDFHELIAEAPKKPTLMGFTDQEAGYFTTMGLSPTLNGLVIPRDAFSSYSYANVTEFVHNVLAPASVFGEKASEVRQLILDFYFDPGRSADPGYLLTRHSDLLSDVLFNVPGLWAARAKARAGWPVYLYYNNYHNKNMFEEGEPVKGSMHANEYPYMFGIMPITTFHFNDDDHKYQRAIVDPIVQFAKHGNPSTTTLKWPAVDVQNPFQHMNICPEPHVQKSLLPEVLAFWDRLTADYDFDIVRGLHKLTKRPKDEL